MCARSVTAYVMCADEKARVCRRCRRRRHSVLLMPVFRRRRRRVVVAFTVRACVVVLMHRGACGNALDAVVSRVRARGEGGMTGGARGRARRVRALAPGTRRRRRRRRDDITARTGRRREAGWCWWGGGQSASSSCKPEFGAHRLMCCLRSVQRLIA